MWDKPEPAANLYWIGGSVLTGSKEGIMKRLLCGICGLAVIAILAVPGFAQRNPRGSSTLDVNGKTVSVEFGRPSLKGRNVDELLGKLKPGDVWRLGADKSTTFSTPIDLMFGDVTLPAGEYSLWARREAGDTWKLVFNKQHGQWGPQHDAAQDLVAVPLKESKLTNPQEMVSISLNKAKEGGLLVIEWGDKKLAASFKAK